MSYAPTLESYRHLLSEICQLAGARKAARAALFLNMNYDSMLKVAESKQPKYDKLKNNCGVFAARVVCAGNPKIDLPNVVIPTPRNIVEEFIEEGNAEITYDPKADTLIVCAGNEADAKE